MAPDGRAAEKYYDAQRKLSHRYVAATGVQRRVDRVCFTTAQIPELTGYAKQKLFIEVHSYIGDNVPLFNLALAAYLVADGPNAFVWCWQYVGHLRQLARGLPASGLPKEARQADERRCAHKRQRRRRHVHKESRVRHKCDAAPARGQPARSRRMQANAVEPEASLHLLRVVERRHGHGQRAQQGSPELSQDGRPCQAAAVARMAKQ